MEKAYIGGDVSKAKIDFAVPTEEGFESYIVKNNESSLKKFFTKYASDQNIQVVVEATGIYHHRLAVVLEELKIKYSIVNPKRIANHAKTSMQRGKTDKADAKLIADYAKKHIPEVYKMPSALMLWAQSILKAIDNCSKDLSVMGGRYEADSNNPMVAKEVLSLDRKRMKALKAEIEKLALLLEKRLQEEKSDDVRQIRTIDGVGPRVSSVIIAFFGRFENFKTHKQVVGYIGTDPLARESGTFKGKRHISKQGNRYIRKILYMASLSAGVHNKSCAELKARLKAKGKSHRQICIAIVNKLIRQIFAVVKYDRVWDENYCRA